jgi:ATP-dependent Clp protease adaptor protein ClpS
MAQNKDDTILEAQRSKLKPPPMFKVMLLNDDYTPMEFVVVVLQKFFSMTRERATQVMLKVHLEGIGVTAKALAYVGSTRATWRQPKCSKSRHTPGSTSIRCNA